MRRFAGAALASGFGAFGYWPPLGLDTALIRYLASVVPRFRKAMEQPQA